MLLPEKPAWLSVRHSDSPLKVRLPFEVLSDLSRRWKVLRKVRSYEVCFSNGIVSRIEADRIGVGVHEGIARHCSEAARRLERRWPTAEGARMTRRLVAGIAATISLLLLPACTSHSYMGIPLAAGQVDPELQQLANRAQAGDKQAQLELGIRFEEGRGLPVDIGRAQRLYQQAASDSGGTVWVYVPPTVKGQRARVMPVASGPEVSGLAQAKARLEALEAAK